MILGALLLAKPHQKYGATGSVASKIHQNVTRLGVPCGATNITKSSVQLREIKINRLVNTHKYQIKLFYPEFSSFPYLSNCGVAITSR